MKYFVTDSETYGELVVTPTMSGSTSPMSSPTAPRPSSGGTPATCSTNPPNTTVGQARSGLWWAQCTRPDCDFYSSCLRTRNAAIAAATIHQAHHDCRKARRDTPDRRNRPASL